MSHQRKFFPAKYLKMSHQRKFFSREIQKFRGWADPRKFLPAKVSDLKVSISRKLSDYSILTYIYKYICYIFTSEMRKQN